MTNQTAPVSFDRVSVSFDVDHKGRAYRVFPRDGGSTRVRSYGVATDEQTGRAYRFNFFLSKDGAREVALYSDGGRSVPENHKTNVRAAVLAAYVAQFESWKLPRAAAPAVAAIVAAVSSVDAAKAATVDVLAPLARCTSPAAPFHSVDVDLIAFLSRALPGLKNCDAAVSLGGAALVAFLAVSVWGVVALSFANNRERAARDRMARAFSQIDAAARTNGRFLGK